MLHINKPLLFWQKENERHHVHKLQLPRHFCANQQYRTYFWAVISRAIYDMLFQSYSLPRARYQHLNSAHSSAPSYRDPQNIIDQPRCFWNDHLFRRLMNKKSDLSSTPFPIIYMKLHRHLLKFPGTVLEQSAPQCCRNMADPLPIIYFFS